MIYLIEDADGALYNKAAFDTPMACTRYIQRFGEPGWRKLPVALMDLDEVNALPNSESTPTSSTLRKEGDALD